MPFREEHPLYRTWLNMKQRCTNPRHPQWGRYGGRGITVCERWMRDFHAFISDMGPRPIGMSLDRADNDKGYSPDNCRWAAPTTQNRNQHWTRYVRVEGRRYLAVELAERAGIKTDTVITRARRGLPMEKVLSTEPLERDPDEHQASMRRAILASAGKKRAATHCQRGHEFTPENTQITSTGGRRCRACTRLRDEEYREARRGQ